MKWNEIGLIHSRAKSLSQDVNNTGTNIFYYIKCMKVRILNEIKFDIENYSTE